MSFLDDTAYSDIRDVSRKRVCVNALFHPAEVQQKFGDAGHLSTFTTGTTCLRFNKFFTYFFHHRSVCLVDPMGN